MIVMPADHVIEPAETLPEDRPGRGRASSRPTRPPSSPSASSRPGPRPATATSSAASRSGPRDGIAVHRVAQFREKPDRATAEQFLADGPFAWNSGIFLWKARAILDALRRHRPGLAAALGRVAAALGTPDEAATIAREFPRMERIPIDKAVMEKAANVRVLEVLYDWNDVGDWRPWPTLIPADAQGNTDPGRRSAPSTPRDSIIISDDGGLIATLGVDDLVDRPVRRGDPRRPQGPARQAQGAGRGPRREGGMGTV